MSKLESLSRSLYDATGDVKDMNQMLIPLQVLRDWDASHQRLKEALEEIAENDPYKVSSAGLIARAALEQAKDLE